MKLRGFTYYSLNTNRKAAGGNSTASSSPPRVFRPRADVFGLFRTGALAPDTRVAVSSLGKQMAILHDFTDDTARSLFQAGIGPANIYGRGDKPEPLRERPEIAYDETSAVLLSVVSRKARFLAGGAPSC